MAHAWQAATGEIDSPGAERHERPDDITWHLARPEDYYEGGDR
jgi:hypothetical protein